MKGRVGVKCGGEGGQCNWGKDADRGHVSPGGVGGRRAASWGQSPMWISYHLMRGGGKSDIQF